MAAPIKHREATPLYVVVQILNNQGAKLLRNGRYGPAIHKLISALKISERITAADGANSNDGENTMKTDCCCSCRLCTLDECMSSSFDDRKSSLTTHALEEQRRSQHQTTHSTLGSTLSTYSRTANSNATDIHDERNRSNCGYLFENPIFVSRLSIEERHQMGTTLSLIVVFNLALAYHLSALQHYHLHHHQQANQEQQVHRRLGQAKHLYEVAYRLQGRVGHHNETLSSSSLRFMMIVSNNLGEIYRLMKDDIQHQRCLEHLLSMMMLVFNNCQFPTGYTSVRDLNELEGFLRNTSRLILREQCANAA